MNDTIQRYDLATTQPAHGAAYGCLIANASGDLMYHSAHLAAIAIYEARLAEAISLMKEAAPAIDLISFALSERFDRFLAVHAKEDKS